VLPVHFGTLSVESAKFVRMQPEDLPAYEEAFADFIERYHWCPLCHSDLSLTEDELNELPLPPSRTRPPVELPIARSAASQPARDGGFHAPRSRPAGSMGQIDEGSSMAILCAEAEAFLAARKS